MGIVVIIVIIFIVAAAGTVFGIKTSRTSIALERLRALKTLDEQEEKLRKLDKFEDEELEKSFYVRIIQPILDRWASKFSKSGASKKDKELQNLIIMAGNPGNLTPAQFKAIQMLLGVISICGILAFVALLGLPKILYVLSAVGAVFSFVLPQFILKSKVTARKKDIRKSLPDTLDLLVVSVEAGLGFDQALQKVVDKSIGALPDEFRRTLQEIRVGKQRRDALKDMGERCMVDELTTFISGIIQADTLGVSVGHILRIQSEQIRTKRRQMVEEQAQKAPLKMLFPMIFFIFPTIFIVVLGPIALKVRKELSGLF